VLPLVLVKHAKAVYLPTRNRVSLIWSLLLSSRLLPLFSVTGAARFSFISISMI
jgi:hypothetical protein